MFLIIFFGLIALLLTFSFGFAFALFFIIGKVFDGMTGLFIAVGLCFAYMAGVAWLWSVVIELIRNT